MTYPVLKAIADTSDGLTGREIGDLLLHDYDEEIIEGFDLKRIRD